MHTDHWNQDVTCTNRTIGNGLMRTMVTSRDAIDVTRLDPDIEALYNLGLMY
jgi:hypothetical protein